MSDDNSPLPFTNDFLIDIDLLHISDRIMSSPEIWAKKSQWYEESKKSEEFWENTMSEDERQALVRMVRRTLEQFHDSVETWLPTSVEPIGGEYVEIKMGILLSKIDHEIDIDEEATSFQVREAQSNIQKMIDKVGNGKNMDPRS